MSITFDLDLFEVAVIKVKKNIIEVTVGDIAG